MTIERVIILHGYTASPQSHWFEWLRNEVADAGIEVSIPLLPDSSEPVLDAWVAAATTALGASDERTVVIGHSLGAITAMHALAGQPAGWRLGGFLGVAGFAESLATIPALDPFIAAPPALDEIARSITRRAMLLSDNDDIVPPAASQRMAAALDASLILMPGAGHFLGREGCTELPEIAQLIREWASSPVPAR